MKKILFISGSRADYGIMKNLLKELEKTKEIELLGAITGMHMDSKYGNTYKIIEEDGFKIDFYLDININTSTNSHILKSMSICQDGFGNYFQDKKYDAIIILGDRYEIFSVAIAAAMHNIPIIHLHGGEKTLGNYDEFIRHSITKMSKLHLTATEEYRKRVIQMGESPDSVFNIGALGAENAIALKKLNLENLESKFGKFNKPYFMVVFHPETLTKISIEEQLENLLNAFDLYKEKYDFVFIGSNSDTSSDIIYRIIDKYTKENKFKFLTSVKTDEYMSLIKFSRGIIGNSSSGLIEVPSLEIPTINIGDRQKGRVRGNSVIDIKAKTPEICEAIKKIEDAEFRNKIKKENNPYYKEKSSTEAKEIILNFLNKKLILKDFYDL